MRYGGPCSEPHDEERMFEHARNSVRLAGNHIYAPDSSRVMQLWNTVGRVQADMCATGNRSSLTPLRVPIVAERLNSPQTIDLIGSAPADVAGVEEISGRRTFDKTVSSKPLAFAADAAAMGIEWCFGTFVPSRHGRVRQGELALCEAPGLMLHPGLLRSKRTFGIDADLPLCATRSVRRVSGLLETQFSRLAGPPSQARKGRRRTITRPRLREGCYFDLLATSCSAMSIIVRVNMISLPEILPL